MVWDSVYSLRELPYIPEGKFLYCFFLPEELFFALVNAGDIKTYWLGLLKNPLLAKKSKGDLVFRLYFHHYRGFTIRVVTRAIYFGVTKRIKREITTLLTENPCLKHLSSNDIALRIALKSISDVEEGKTIIRTFIKRAEGFCFPGSCGCALCDELGGVAVPTYIGGEEIC